MRYTQNLPETTTKIDFSKLCLLVLLASSFACCSAFIKVPERVPLVMMSATMYPFSFSSSSRPGDPTFILTTNVDLGSKKMEIMMTCSTLIAVVSGKSESDIAVIINDKADVIFGGSDAPITLGCLYSIGSICKLINESITASITDLLEEFGIQEDRIYINFFDIPRANVTWSRNTFEG